MRDAKEDNYVRLSLLARSLHLLGVALLAAFETSAWGLLFVRSLRAVLLVVADFTALEATSWSFLLISRLGAVRFGMPLFSALKASSEKENQDVNSKLKVTL